MRDTMAKIGMPRTITGSFQVTAHAFRQALDSQPRLILAALITVCLLLGILYESYIHLLTFLSTMLSADDYNFRTKYREADTP